MDNKRGQFFLIAAVVIIVVIVSIATVSNYTQKKDTIKLYDLGQQLGIESQQVLDYGTYSGLSEDDMNTLMERFIRNYVSYVKENKNVYFVFGNKDKINVIGYQDIKNESVCVELSPAPICGNNIVEDGEQCDMGSSNGVAGEPCNSTCGLVNSTAKVSSCGDGIVEGTEQCDMGSSNGVAGEPCNSTCGLVNPDDGCNAATTFCTSANLNEKTCSDLGFKSAAGTLACNSQCGFDIGNCVTQDYCGDGIVEGTEQCDLKDLKEQSCTSLGFYGGTALGCTKDCNFDISNCVKQEKQCDSYLNVGQSQPFSPAAGTIQKVVIRISNIDYEFTLKRGENFYFVIWENVAGEKQVVTS